MQPGVSVHAAPGINFEWLDSHPDYWGHWKYHIDFVILFALLCLRLFVFYWYQEPCILLISLLCLRQLPENEFGGKLRSFPFYTKICFEHIHFFIPISSAYFWSHQFRDKQRAHATSALCFFLFFWYFFNFDLWHATLHKRHCGQTLGGGNCRQKMLRKLL